MSTFGIHIFWLLVVLSCLWGIWGGSLDTWDEGLTAERSREMFRQGWSMTVHYLGQPDFNKPPLYYWIVAACFSLFGLGEFAVRLSSIAWRGATAWTGPAALRPSFCWS
jgi:4-amino-4-deoxy-L-arabinose transferase-like glycosyltransferase